MTRQWIPVTPPVRPTPVRQYRRVVPFVASCQCRGHRAGFAHIDLELV